MVMMIGVASLKDDHCFIESFWRTHYIPFFDKCEDYVSYTLAEVVASWDGDIE